MGLVSLCLIFVNPLEAAEEIPVLEVEEESGHALPRGWELTTHHGTADLATVRETIGPVLRFHSNSSSFSIQKEITVDLRRTPWLTWDWKVTALPEGGSFTDSDADDQCAQLILAFSKRFWQMRKTVAYLWGGESPTGTMGDSAAGSLLPFVQMKAVVVRSGKRDLDK
jgi:hypothetical protein